VRMEFVHERIGATGLLVLLGAACLWGPRDASAITPGRAWAPTEVFRILGGFTRPDVITRDQGGAPFVIAGGPGGVGGSLYGVRWVGSTWATTWGLGYDVNFVHEAVGEPDDFRLVWQTLQPLGPNGNMSYLVAAEASETSVAVPESVATILSSPFRYAETVRGNHRWIAKANAGDLRLWRSDMPGVWTELDMPGVGSDGIAVGAVDDSSVLVVFQWLREGTRWGHMRGSTWEEGSPLLTSNGLGLGVRLRQNPDGGYWAGWAENSRDYILARYRNGAWSERDTIHCAFRLTDQYLSASSEISRETNYEYPAATWSSFSTVNGVETICACIPTDHGFTVADNLEGSESGIRPVIVRDRNGDAWVAWWQYGDGMFFTHSYTIATSSAPEVTDTGSNRTIQWTLSELAPETWWAVLAASNDGPFGEVARIRAADALDLEWTDTSAPSDSIRYRIRRECVDTRYQWLSDETVWRDEPVAVDPPLTPAFALEGFVPNPSVREASIAFTLPTSTRATLEVLDIAGRRVMRREVGALGAGRHIVKLDSATALRPGVYLIRLTSSGNAAHARGVITR
jgi:hypothetical protein